MPQIMATIQMDTAVAIVILVALLPPPGTDSRPRQVGVIFSFNKPEIYLVAQ